MTLHDKIKIHVFNENKKLCMYTLLHQTNYMLSQYINKTVVNFARKY